MEKALATGEWSYVWTSSQHGWVCPATGALFTVQVTVTCCEAPRAISASAAGAVMRA